MLNGERVVLAPLREADLAAFYEAHVDIRTRGAYFPLGVVSESTWRARFAQNGLWERDEGTLLIRDLEGRIVGHIEFFPPVGYWDAYELSYQLYDASAAGMATRPRRFSCWSTTCSAPRRSTASSS